MAKPGTSEIYLLLADTGHHYNVDETDLYEDRIVQAYRSATVAWQVREQAEKQARAVFDAVLGKYTEEQLSSYCYGYGSRSSEVEVPGTVLDPEMKIARSQFDTEHQDELPVRYKIKAISLDER